MTEEILRRHASWRGCLFFNYTARLLGMEPFKKCILFVLVCLALVLSGCSEDEDGDGGCKSDQDCDPGLHCCDGVCMDQCEGGPHDAGEPDAGEPDGGGGDDGGGDVGTDLGPLWTITPGVGSGS